MNHPPSSHESFEFSQLQPEVNEGEMQLLPHIEVLEKVSISTTATAAGDNAHVPDPKHAGLPLANNTQQNNLQELLADLSFALSHEMRAPLRILNGYTGLLKEELQATSGTEAAHFLGLIQTNADFMSAQIDALVTLLRQEQNTPVVQMVDNNQLVAEAISKVSALYPATQIILHDLPPTRADVSMFRLLWKQLIDNAFKFSAPVTLAVVEVGHMILNNELVYYVKDNGVGFNTAYADNLFRVFRRLHKKTDFSGIGLGLAQSKCVIQKHGGKIWADAAEGAGATFYFSIPDLKS
jgi:light-regulated signal transduction histidine kinase (bacteriophytochrome)